MSREQIELELDLAVGPEEIEEEGEGVVTGVHHTPMSGLLAIFIRRDNGSVRALYADAGPFLRAVERAFGTYVITGQRIRYTMSEDGLDLMTGFSPLDTEQN